MFHWPRSALGEACKSRGGAGLKRYNPGMAKLACLTLVLSAALLLGACQEQTVHQPEDRFGASPKISKGGYEPKRTTNYRLTPDNGFYRN